WTRAAAASGCSGLRSTRRRCGRSSAPPEPSRSAPAQRRSPRSVIRRPRAGAGGGGGALRELTVLAAEAEAPDVEYLCGTMIELPRACIRADEIAQHADFFSFGTNDL